MEQSIQTIILCIYKKENKGPEILLVHYEIECSLCSTFEKEFSCFDCNAFSLYRENLIRGLLHQSAAFRFLNYSALVHTSSGNQTPGFVLPSRIARANAAVAFPTDLQHKFYFSHISFKSSSTYFHIRMSTPHYKYHIQFQPCNILQTFKKMGIGVSLIDFGRKNKQIDLRIT